MNSRSHRFAVFLQAAAIFAGALFVYSPALRGGWLWDDDTAVTGNQLVQDAAGLPKIWFHSTNLDYFPLKASVEWAECQLWGDNPLGYHVVNVFLHLAGAFLFWRILTRLGVKSGWIGGLLFAVHPMAVDSVAWISELKNTLSLPFLLLSFDRYLTFEDTGRRGSWTASVLLYLAAILCKSSVVMFPAFLLLYALWKRGRIVRLDFAWTTPFFALSLLLGFVTVRLQAGAATLSAGDPMVGVGMRIAHAVWILGFYGMKSLVPVDLSPVYPYGARFPFVAFGIGLVATTLLLIFKPRGTRGVILGVGTFVLMLVPVLGFLRMSFNTISPVSDHLAYLSLLGVVGLVAAGVDRLESLFSARKTVITGLLIALASVLAFQGRQYAVIFRNTETFWTYTLGRNPTAWIAHYNLGVIRETQGRKEDAIAQYEAAIRVKPDDGPAHSNLAMLLIGAGKAEEGLAEAQRAIALEPGFAPAEYNLGNAYLALGHTAEAIGPYEEALRLKPDYLEAHVNLGSSLFKLRRYQDSAAQFRAAIALSPKSAQAYFSLARDDEAMGAKDSELADYESALRLDPGISEAAFKAGALLAASGKLTEAIPYYEQGLKDAPSSPVPEENLGVILANLGRMEEASGHFQKAVKLDPGYEKARRDLAQAMHLLGRDAGAEVRSR